MRSLNRRSALGQVSAYWLGLGLPLSGQASTALPSTALTHPAALAPEIQALRQAGEAALARGQLSQATLLFAQAAAKAHEPGIELGQVRTAMQMGHYEQALGFAAHTAGAHRKDPPGAALYAWLLALGDQRDMAFRVLQGALAVNPQDSLLRHVQTTLQREHYYLPTEHLRAPARLAPYSTRAVNPSSGTHTPPRMRWLGTGTLLQDGKAALVALTPNRAQLPQQWWVRDGMGRLASAQVAMPVKTTGLALLKLDQPLPTATPAAAMQAAFPGSVAYVVRHSSPDTPAHTTSIESAWPFMRAGFVGAALEGSSERWLNVPLPTEPPAKRGSVGLTAHCSPSFNSKGQLIGLAVSQADQSAKLMTCSELARTLRTELFGQALATATALTPSAIYEIALGNCLQVMASA